MHKLFYAILVVTAVSLVGCKCDSDCNGQVLSERYIHKYGYDVAKGDWEENSYPGQVITTLKNGVTVNSNYEDGRLHGTCTYTYPHSQTLESAHLYDRGHLIKKTTYSLYGSPTREEIYLSPARTKITTWYASGTPLRIEEYEQGTILEGEYFNENNKVESRVTAGEGVRTVRNAAAQLVARETIEGGQIALRTEYYETGTPYAVTPFRNGKVHGTKKQYAPGGEPMAREDWLDGVPHGVFVYFQNGAKYVETPYVRGYKNGIERTFTDGEQLTQETEWIDGKRHGPTIAYLDGYNKVEWYYDNVRVTKDKYNELCEQERHIAKLNHLSSRDYE